MRTRGNHSAEYTVKNKTELIQVDKDMGTAAVRKNNFEPRYDFGPDQDCNTLRIHVPGFKKDELKVQLFLRSGVRVLKITGTGKPTLEDETGPIFEKEFILSKDCDPNKITATFERDTLHVINAKLIKEDKQIPPPKTPKESPAAKTDQEEEAIQKTTPDKPVQNKEAKSANIRDDEQNAGENMYPKNDTDNAKLKAETLAYKLKMDKQKMTILLAFLFAFALAMCISNLQAWFSKKNLRT